MRCSRCREPATYVFDAQKWPTTTIVYEYLCRVCWFHTVERAFYRLLP